MKFSLPRAGVFAPAAIFFVSLFGAGTPVAQAQDQAPLAYIAEEVVQPLPTEETLEARFAQRSGVDVDAEMAAMVTLQNAYAANARVISTVQRMWDDLLASVR